ncbi:glycosyltransferase family 2 protein [Pseudanabaena sp. FACHB-1998]|uniref:glycosyltransferase family 2 protein n=1 Tax=Pseudanabaena sp. FACHB-1998 TaxID=2692858 RepID=UPI0016817993|nr:glycosyltransferase family 2 protein [Pseudanabaena sp. FACHB-1998]MBD2176620.1 glycosyltransferase family 2 protein [Pseudanabaena sp. FACHB-1998]
MKPLVSTIIPAYNAAPYISETLDSALSQTWQNIEIIVVDDGSKDDTLAIAKKYESKKVKVINQQNKGASAARNRALKEAQGDFIQYLDADDLLASDKIERQLKLLDFNPLSNYSVSGEWARFYQKPYEAVFTPQSLWSDMSPITWLVTAWEKNLMMHPGAWLVSRNITESAGIWNEKISLNDDGEYFCRIILASKEVKFCAGAKSYYRSGISGSLSGSKSRQALESVYLSVDLCTNNLLAVEDSERTRLACANFFQRFIYELYPEAYDLIKKSEEKIKQFGGSNIKPLGSPRFEFLSYFLGWKCAKRIQTWTYEFKDNSFFG